MLAAVEALWPGSGAVELTWRVAGRPGAARSFRVVPSLARPRYLVPSDGAAASALSHTEPGLRSVPMRVLSRLQRSGLLHRLPGPRLHVHTIDGPGVEAVLTEVLGEVGSVVVQLGRPRPNRAVVLWVLDPRGVPLAVVKIARSKVAHAALEREFRALTSLSGRPIAGLRMPEALAYLRWAGADLLVLSVLEAESPRRIGRPPTEAMAALVAATGVREVVLRDAPLVARLIGQIAALEDPVGQQWLGAELDCLLGDLGHLVVPAAAWHGDWVPWNMAREVDEVLLWDWEHYDEAALAGFDHLHFLAQYARRGATDTAAEDAWLQRARTALRQTWNLDDAQQEAVLRCYLLAVNLRYLADRQEDAVLAPDRQGWGRPLVERLRGLEAVVSP